MMMPGKVKVGTQISGSIFSQKKDIGSVYGVVKRDPALQYYAINWVCLKRISPGQNEKKLRYRTHRYRN
jgi:hypothetical protein